MNKKLILRALQCYKDQLWRALRINRLDEETETEYINVCHTIEDLEIEEVPAKIELPRKKPAKGILSELMENDHK